MGFLEEFPKVFCLFFSFFLWIKAIFGDYGGDLLWGVGFSDFFWCLLGLGGLRISIIGFFVGFGGLESYGLAFCVFWGGCFGAPRIWVKEFLGFLEALSF